VHKWAGIGCVRIQMNVELCCVGVGVTGWWLLAGDGRIGKEELEKDHWRVHSKFVHKLPSS